MTKCGKLTGAGAVRYPCILEPHDDGPCVCAEKPATRVQRAQWEASQRQGPPEIDMSDHTRDDYTPPEIITVPSESAPPAPEPAQAPETAPEPDTALQGPWEFYSHDVRMSKAAVPFKIGYDQLPVALQSWVMGAQTQIAIVELWWAFKLADTTDSEGNKVLVLSQSDIETLIPESLRG